MGQEMLQFLHKKVKRALFEEVDNSVWNGGESEVSSWCRRNKAFNEITEEEIEELWSRETPDDEPVRLNGKYVRETAKRVCDFLNTHEELIGITTLGEFRNVLLKVMRVIKEAHNREKKRILTSWKKKSDEMTVIKQKPRP